MFSYSLSKEREFIKDNSDRLEIWIYGLIDDWVTKNEIYINDSIEFKRFENYLMSWEEYDETHKEIFEEIGTDFLTDDFESHIIKNSTQLIISIIF